MSGISAAMFGAILQATLGPCQHPRIVDVTTIADELVAWLCVDCGQQLPAEWAKVEPSAT